MDDFVGSLVVSGFHTDIEKDTIENTNFRKVIFTGPNIQLVLMNLKAGEDIGSEVHMDLDQFIRVDAGSGKVVIGGETFSLKDGSAIVIPAGTYHNVIAGSRGLKLYAVYSSNEHPEDAVHKTKEEAVEKSLILTPVQFELQKAKSGDSEYINKDGTFKGGFDGCVKHQREKKGLSEKSAKKLCAYIGRRAGKIP